MPIDHAAFIRPISPPNGVDGTVPFITSADAKLEVEGAAFLRVTWKRASDCYQLVPLTNVRELHCSEPAQSTAPQPTTKTVQQQPSPKPKAR